MPLWHHSIICGLILGATRCVLGHRHCAGKQERGNSEADGQAPVSLMGNRNHCASHFCPGVQTCSFAVIIPPDERFGAGTADVSLLAAECQCTESNRSKAKLCNSGQRSCTLSLTFRTIQTPSPTIS